MAFSKSNAAVATAAPVAAPEVVAPIAQAAPAEAKGAAPAQKVYTDTKVRGQVAMNAIQTGYETASRLVLTLSPKPTEARDLLHTLAEEIAGKIESYSFRHEEK